MFRSRRGDLLPLRAVVTGACKVEMLRCDELLIDTAERSDRRERRCSRCFHSRSNRSSSAPAAESASFPASGMGDMSRARHLLRVLACDGSQTLATLSFSCQMGSYKVVRVVLPHSLLPPSRLNGRGRGRVFQVVQNSETLCFGDFYVPQYKPGCVKSLFSQFFCEEETRPFV